MAESRGRLGPRLLVAFLAVAGVAVAMVTAAAIVGADRGLSAAAQAERAAAAERVAGEVASAYADAGGWSGTDLTTARAAAQDEGARLVVQGSGGAGRGPGNPDAGPGGAGGGSASADVVVNGQVVGVVRLVFGSPAGTSGRDLAWTWVVVAAVLAVAVAAGGAWWVSRRLSAPLVALADSARAFGAGDRDAHADEAAPGEIGDVARAFNDSAARVRASEDARRRMAADVAHELRTPLAVLQAGLEELRDGLADPTPEVLSALHDQSLRLGRVVEDLATLAGAESPAPSLRLAPVDLGRLVAGVVTTHQGALAGAGLTVNTEIDDGVVVTADADRMAQVLTNLMSNATRYCRPGDVVTVSVRRGPDGDALLAVADTGPGIAPEELPHVFDRFWRGQDRADGVPGSGLGLPVVRALVEAHGGRVDVESLVGSGTTVTVVLPGVTGSAGDQSAARTSTTASIPPDR